MKTSLYRHFNENDVLLYVGISKNAIARLRGHKDKCWYDEIAYITIQRHETRQAALRSEAIAIRDEGALYNIVKPKIYEVPRRRPSLTIDRSQRKEKVVARFGYVLTEERFLDAIMFDLEQRGVDHDLIFVDTVTDFEHSSKGLGCMMKMAQHAGTEIVLPFPPSVPKEYKDILRGRGIKIMTCTPDGLSEVSHLVDKDENTDDR